MVKTQIHFRVRSVNIKSQQKIARRSQTDQIFRANNRIRRTGGGKAKISDSAVRTRIFGSPCQTRRTVKSNKRTRQTRQIAVEIGAPKVSSKSKTMIFITLGQFVGDLKSVVHTLLREIININAQPAESGDICLSDLSKQTFDGSSRN